MYFIRSQDKTKYGTGIIEIVENKFMVDDKVFGVYKTHDEALSVLNLLYKKHIDVKNNAKYINTDSILIFELPECNVRKERRSNGTNKKD